MVFAAQLAHQAFLHRVHARLGGGRGFDALTQFAEAVFVHNVGQRRAENAPGVVGDDGGRDQRRPVVRAFPALAHDQRNADAEEGGERGQRVAAVVPRLRFQRTARRFAAFALVVAEQPFLDGDHGDEDDEGKRRRVFVRGDDVSDAFVGDDARRGEEEGNGDEGGERLGATVAVGVVRVRRLVGDAQAEIEQE